MPSLLTALLFAMPGAHAAVITWVDSSITGDTNVSNSGTTIEAANFGGAGVPGVTINSVTFAGIDFGGGGSPTNLTGLTYDNSQTGHATSTGGNIDTLLDTIAFRSGTGTQSLTLSGLTIGREYQVQFFLSHPPTGGRTQTINDGNGNTGVLVSSPATYTTGTFTADGVTQSLTITSSSGSQIMSGYQLRDITVPEPSSLLLAAMSALLVFRRRR